MANRQAGRQAAGAAFVLKIKQFQVKLKQVHDAAGRGGIGGIESSLPTIKFAVLCTCLGPTCTCLSTL